MKKWAEVHGDRVWAILDVEDDAMIPVAAPPVIYVDVTAHEVVPKAGMLMDKDGKFKEPELMPTIPVITRAEFISLFTPSEWKAIKKNEDFAFSVDYIMSCDLVYLNDDIVVKFLNANVAAAGEGALTAGRRDDILSNVKPKEL